MRVRASAFRGEAINEAGTIGLRASSAARRSPASGSARDSFAGEALTGEAAITGMNAVVGDARIVVAKQKRHPVDDQLLLLVRSGGRR